MITTMEWTLRFVLSFFLCSIVCYWVTIMMMPDLHRNLDHWPTSLLWIMFIVVVINAGFQATLFTMMYEQRKTTYQ